MECQGMVEVLTRECEKIQNDAKISAEAQYLSAARYQRMAFWLQLVPAVITALTGTMAATLVVRPYVGWIAASSAVITAVATILNPAQRLYGHLSAAKAFTVIKNEARSTGTAFGPLLSEQDFQRSVQGLVTRYNDLIRLVPQSEAWAIRVLLKSSTRRQAASSQTVEDGK